MTRAEGEARGCVTPGLSLIVGSMERGTHRLGEHTHISSDPARRMTGMLPLRPYQRDALDAVYAATARLNRVAVILPTGGGKTVIFAHLVREHLERRPGTRALVLVHTDELVSQAYDKIRAVAPHLSVGIVKAARNEVRADVVVASVQSLRRAARRDQIRNVSLIIVDECHHATARTYRDILDHYGAFDGRTLAVGFTATLERGDGGPLGEIWEDVAYARDISWMVRQGYLIPPRGKMIQVPDLDLARVRTTRNDYREGDLGEALTDSLAPELVAKAYVEHAGDRPGIAFFPTVASAHIFRDAFLSQGVTCEVVHGAMGVEARRDVLSRFARGDIQVVANCMVLTEGFDSPRVGCIVVGRPTRSRPLYIQMVGRGLRIDPTRPYEEQDCLILDVVGTSAHMDLCSIADLSTKPIRKRPSNNGKTLIELEDEFDREAAAGEERYYLGPVDVREFDPLAAKSRRKWLRTTRGVPFVPAGRVGYVFLVRGATSGTWDVAWCTSDSRTRYHTCGPDSRPAPHCVCGNGCSGRAGDVTPFRGLDMRAAMVAAEGVAQDMSDDPRETLVVRNASWRRKPASDAQKRLADTLGITYPRDVRSGELSDEINRVRGGRRIDPIVHALTRQRERERVTV